MAKAGTIALAILAAVMVIDVASARAEGNFEAGAKQFRNCAACHSLAPGRHMTGPSLAGVWGRKAATAEGFRRYSPALRGTDIVWDQVTLDQWLRDPQAMVPGNRMVFPGLRDEQARADLIAFLQRASAAAEAPSDDAMGGMMKQMTSGPQLPDLKAVGPDQQIVAARHCEDTYELTTAAGETLAFWELNLRLKTDSSETGPPAGRPVLVSSGMLGDRASLVFAAPAEISPFIEEKCQ